MVKFVVCRTVSLCQQNSVGLLAVVENTRLEDVAAAGRICVSNIICSKLGDEGDIGAARVAMQRKHAPRDKKRVHVLPRLGTHLHHRTTAKRQMNRISKTSARNRVEWHAPGFAVVVRC